MNKAEIKKAIKSEEIAIRKILNEWNPIGVSVPEDEYDCLLHQIISKLHSGSSEDDIQIFIQYELKNHFGLKADKKNIKKVAHNIWQFWMRRP